MCWGSQPAHEYGYFLHAGLKCWAFTGYKTQNLERFDKVGDRFAINWFSGQFRWPIRRGIIGGPPPSVLAPGGPSDAVVTSSRVIGRAVAGTQKGGLAQLRELVRDPGTISHQM
jgi:hypothetical protein